MRKQSNTNRMPVYILGGLVMIALIARIMTPPQPPVPGPRGDLPRWTASFAYGKMGAWAVNPSGTMFAGAWSMKGKEGKDLSAIWIIDFEKQEARHYSIKDILQINAMEWYDDKSIGMGAETGSITNIIDLTKGDVSSLNGIKKILKPELPQPPTGTVEDSWQSPAGVLALCRNQDNFTELVYDAKTKKLNQVGKDGFTTDVKTNWPDAPKEMLFVTYRGGFKVDLQTGKTTRIFKYDGLKFRDDFWRKEIQNGRLYPRKDGGYTSVSFAEGKIDIRILGKDGVITGNLLARG